MDRSSISTDWPAGELTQAPLATPVRKPSLLSSSTRSQSTRHKPELSTDTILKIKEEEESQTEAEKRRKHESYLLSGSVFLVTEYGQTLKLPAPSDSPADPLGWKRWQRAGAFLAVAWFTTVALAVAQAAGVLLRVISIDFKGEVGPRFAQPKYFQ